MGAAVGSDIHFELPELGIKGPPASWPSSRVPKSSRAAGGWSPARSRPRCQVLELRVSGQEKALEPTPPHRFKSLDRNDYVPAEDLKIGERLSTRSGQAACVESISLKAGEYRVYNLEVEGDHNFYVGEVGVLVHNACFKDESLERLKQAPEEPGVYHVTNGENKYTGSSMNIRQRITGTSHRAFDLFDDPNSTITYRTIKNMPDKLTPEQQNHILRYYEQTYMDSPTIQNVPRMDGSLNQRLAAAPDKYYDFQQEAQDFGTSWSRQKSL